MDVATAVHGIRSVQGVLQTLGVVLQLINPPQYPDAKHVQDGDDFDFVIVGGGTAGCVLASRLTEIEDWKVLLIEAGGDPPLESVLPSLMGFTAHSGVDWNYTSQDDEYSAQSHKNRAIDLTQGKVLGGSSSINLMFHVRGYPHDYDELAQVAGSSWSYEDVLPYFIKSECLEDAETLQSPSAEWHGRQGPLGITKARFSSSLKYLDALSEVGFPRTTDINDNSLGYTESFVSVGEGIRHSSAHSFLSPIQHRPNLYVMKNTFASKIIFDDKNVAVGVEDMKANGEKIEIKAKREVIASAGALNSPKLLMLSGIGPKESLISHNIDVVSDLPVGKNLQDHIMVPMVIKSSKTYEPSKTSDTSFPFPVFTGFIAINDSQKYPDYQTENFVFPKESKYTVAICAFSVGLEDDICQVLYEAGKDRESIFTFLILLHPESRGEVLLRSSNPKDSPLIKTGYYSKSIDLDNHVKYIRDYQRFMNSSYMKSVGAEIVHLPLPQCEDLEYNSEQYWACYALGVGTTMFHYVGTCPLGTVLDDRLRVRGVQRLRVVDASALTFIPSGNTNAPTIMLAEKAADIIKEDYNFLFSFSLLSETNSCYNDT